jgi:hypothetical protein
VDLDTQRFGIDRAGFGCQLPLRRWPAASFGRGHRAARRAGAVVEQLRGRIEAVETADYETRGLQPPRSTGLARQLNAYFYV